MKTQQTKQENKTNYNFMLKCMVAFTAAAVTTAGICAAVSLKSAAATTTTIAAQMAFASAFTPVFPIALILIGLVCVLPFLFSRNTTYTPSRTVTTGYDNFGFYSPSYSTASVYTDSHHHGHQDTGSVYTSAHVHGHDSHVHGHDSHTHGRSDGGHVHGHR
ncbi:hypothetical protein [Legionella longbeachae]|uniref:Transmembrane protein n=1 Tax=Legionella longbeachae serogroup 1 (strain NSW150) TaxID=661367 RepID=D3HSB5_LEGLN|nr:hypothetical protein [Legionella longbeachae]VEE02299.1 Uncharacterised protein [Legionella oakridgensis]HBD7398209.1 hypothetical protein [Legionella pneumophila]ARB91412.1 hypothetical protein A6J40_04055 [Legionella longbeachae]EEZ95060.1 conserved hypothetical protein [Legionella longbeachae D-4968]QIN32165.1 hypothetical protein GCB94_08430 [Legionella longbeachae]